jgi:hypothetical protein
MPDQSQQEGEAVSAEKYTHRDYTLLVQPVGTGWKVHIIAPGVARVLETMPNTEDRDGKEKVLAEARALVDAGLDK